MNRISEGELKGLIDELLKDRDAITSLNPDLSHRDAILWMLLGVLASLLSVPIAEQAAVYDPGSSDAYYQAVIRILEHRREPPFDAALTLERIH